MGKQNESSMCSKVVVLESIWDVRWQKKRRVATRSSCSLQVQFAYYKQCSAAKLVT